MKWLKEKTVIQFFIRNGGRLHPDGYWISLPSKHQIIYLNLYRKESLKEGKKKEPSLEIHDARWSKKGNVHIDSYWGWPRSLAELQRIWDEIRQTYGALAGISWKDRVQIEWELKREKKEARQFYYFNRKWAK